MRREVWCTQPAVGVIPLVAWDGMHTDRLHYAGLRRWPSCFLEPVVVDHSSDLSGADAPSASFELACQLLGAVAGRENHLPKHVNHLGRRAPFGQLRGGGWLLKPLLALLVLAVCLLRVTSQVDHLPSTQPLMSKPAVAY